MKDSSRVEETLDDCMYQSRVLPFIDNIGAQHKIELSLSLYECVLPGTLPRQLAYLVRDASGRPIDVKIPPQSGQRGIVIVAEDDVSRYAERPQSHDAGESGQTRPAP